MLSVQIPDTHTGYTNYYKCLKEVSILDNHTKYEWNFGP